MGNIQSYDTNQYITWPIDDLVCSKEANALDAAAQGASNAVMLVANIIANLISFLAFVAFLNGIVSWFCGLLGFPYVTFEVSQHQQIQMDAVITFHKLDSLLQVSYSFPLPGWWGFPTMNATRLVV